MAKRVGIDRDAVVRAAAKIADDEGWDALTLARVAGRLRVRSPSLYNHVGGLEALRRELKLLVMRELNTALTRATIGKSRDDAVRALAAAYRAFVKRHPGTYAATMVAAPKNDPAVEAAAGHIVETLTVGAQRLRTRSARGDPRYPRDAQCGARFCCARNRRRLRHPARRRQKLRLARLVSIEGSFVVVPNCDRTKRQAN